MSEYFSHSFLSHPQKGIRWETTLLNYPLKEWQGSCYFSKLNWCLKISDKAKLYLRERKRIMAVKVSLTGKCIHWQNENLHFLLKNKGSEYSLVQNPLKALLASQDFVTRYYSGERCIFLE